MVLSPAVSSGPLAYLFWHQPHSPQQQADYERALIQFHSQLAAAPPPGLQASRSFRVPELPWLEAGGYEDWYVVEDFAALGALNAGAVDPLHRPSHQQAAELSGRGAGGLYRLVSGTAQALATSHHWFAKPEGMDRSELHRWGGTGRPDGALWQRQMVLGPAPEYCLVGGASPSWPGVSSLVVSVLSGG